MRNCAKADRIASGISSTDWLRVAAMGCTISRSQQTSSTQENCSLTISEMTSQPNPPTSASGTLQTLGSENDRLGKLPMEMKVALLAAMPDLETLRTVSSTAPNRVSYRGIIGA